MAEQVHVKCLKCGTEHWINRPRWESVDVLRCSPGYCGWNLKAHGVILDEEPAIAPTSAPARTHTDPRRRGGHGNHGSPTNGAQKKERSQQALAFIRRHIDDHGYAPSVREIGRAIGVPSTFLVRTYLAYLQRQGDIECAPGIARGIRLATKTLAVAEGEPVADIHTADHNSTPYSVQPVANSYRILDGSPRRIMVAETHGRNAKVNAAFIARACNNFDALLMACEHAIEVLEAEDLKDAAQDVRNMIAGARKP